MATLKTTFSLEDLISAKLNQIADAGQKALENLDKSTRQVAEALDRTAGSASSVAEAADGVGVSASGMQQDMSAASNAADALAQSIGNSDQILTAFAQQADNSANSVTSLEDMLGRCDESAYAMSEAMQANEAAQDALNNAMQDTAAVISSLCSSENLSAEAKERLAAAGQETAGAMSGLESAAAGAERAMQAYDAVMTSGTDDLAALAEAVQSVDAAQQALAAANDRANTATAQLFQTIQQSTQQSSNYASSIDTATQSTDYWTLAVGNYSRETLEAVYSTQELVDMGYKSADALNELAQQQEISAQAQNNLNAAIESAAAPHDALEKALEQAQEMAEKMSEADNLSAEAKDALRSAAEDAAEALRQLSQAQEQADNAMQQYNETLESGTENLGALEAAASRANEAAENLATANATASEAAETLSQATGEASKAAQDAGNSGTSAAESIAGALASAGIVASVHKISEEVYELADAFSDAESTVVLATGAAGDALDSLTDSMMSAYSAAKYGDLSETAAAVGEINTRLGYTGELLSETTELYLDYAAVTGGSASSSVRSLTQLMNQWNIEAAETESVMDKLSYAGQAAGISVTSLTSDLINNKPILDQLNFSLDESIAMFSRFELYGTNASSVMTGFRTALSSGAISSLEDLYDVFEQISSGAMDAAAASDIFGSRAGTTIVDAVRQGVFEMDSFVEALETSGGVMEATAETAQTLSQQWEQANQKVSASFTNALEPTISDASSALAGLWGQVGDFLGEHETATKVIASMGAGIGSVASAFGLYTAAVKIAQPITALFGTTLNAAIWPLTAAAAAIAALSAAVLILRDNYKTVYNEVVSMSASTREQTERLEALQAEYEEVAATQGAESEAALRLRYQIDDLTAYLDENGRSVAELSDEIQSAVKQHDDLTQSYKDSMDAIDAESVSIASLAAKLKDMAGAGSLTASSLEGMQSIIDTLNLKVDGLDLTIPDVVQDPNAVADYINQMLQQQAEQQKTEQSWQRYIDLLSEKDTDMDAFAKAGAELRAAQSQYDEAASAFDGKVYTADSLLGHITTTGAIYQAASDTFDTATENFESARIALEETDAELESLEKQLGITKEAVEDYGKSVPSASEIANLAIQSTQDEITALCQAYEDAYEAALDSFEGQFGLFDQAQSSAEATVYSAQTALNSQLTYWTNYTANLETLRDYGETLTGEAAENYNALMSYVQSGDEEAAGLAANIAAYISQGRYEAVEQLAETNAQVAEMQQTAAATIGEWQTDFDAQLEQITQSMDDFIDSLSGDQYTEDAKTAAKQIVEGYTSTFAGGISDYIDQYNSDMEAFQSDVEDYVDDLVTELDFGDEAKSAAQSAISEYIQAITDSEDEAVSAATALAAAVANALGAAGSVNVSTEAAGTTTGYATGTTNAAEDVFIAGENGPELIIGKKGSEVFPASETARIIAAVNGSDSALASAGGDTYYNAGDTNSVSTNYDYGRSVDETFNSYQTTNNYTTAAAEPERANTESTIADGFVLLSETLENLTGKFTSESENAFYDEISALPAYASGTTDSAENFIAGENGPELIIGQPDSTIFPADETARLMNALSDSEITAALPDDSRWHRELMGGIEETTAEIINSLSTLYDDLAQTDADDLHVGGDTENIYYGDDNSTETRNANQAYSTGDSRSYTEYLDNVISTIRALANTVQEGTHSATENYASADNRSYTDYPGAVYNTLYQTGGQSALTNIRRDAQNENQTYNGAGSQSYTIYPASVYNALFAAQSASYTASAEAGTPVYQMQVKGGTAPIYDRTGSSYADYSTAAPASYAQDVDYIIGNSALANTVQEGTHSATESYETVSFPDNAIYSNAGIWQDNARSAAYVTGGSVWNSSQTERNSSQISNSAETAAMQIETALNTIYADVENLISLAERAENYEPHAQSGNSYDYAGSQLFNAYADGDASTSYQYNRTLDNYIATHEGGWSSDVDYAAIYAGDRSYRADRRNSYFGGDTDTTASSYDGSVDYSALSNSTANAEYLRAVSYDTDTSFITGLPEAVERAADRARTATEYNASSIYSSAPSSIIAPESYRSLAESLYQTDASAETYSEALNSRHQRSTGYDYNSTINYHGAAAPANTDRRQQEENLYTQTQNLYQRTESPLTYYDNAANALDSLTYGDIINAPELYGAVYGGTENTDSRTIYMPQSESEERAEKPLYVAPPQETQASAAAPTSSKQQSEKRIYIDIGGSGKIEISGGMNKTQVMEILTEKLKPVLLDIIAQDAFEEGDDTYGDF